MKIIAKNVTELLNVMYGDNEDYSYVKDVRGLINDYIEYLEDIREDDNFADNGYIGDIINLLEQIKLTQFEEEEEYDVIPLF